MLQIELPETVAVIYVELFKAKIIVTVNKEELKELKELNDLDIDLEDFETCLGSFFELKKDRSTIFLLSINCDVLGVKVHESVHAAHCLMDFYGVPISYDNTEVEAFLVELITERLIEITSKPKLSLLTGY